MSLEETLTVLNAMQADGVTGAYAIGGAVAAFLYIEPGTTFDLDVFIAWEPGAGGLLNVTPLYTWLMARGCSPKGETVTIAGWTCSSYRLLRRWSRRHSNKRVRWKSAVF